MLKYAGIIALVIFSVVAFVLSKDSEQNTTQGHVRLDPRQPQAQQIPSSPIKPAPSPTFANDADFDFYVLALSWSPTFCDSDAGKNNRQQCASNRRFGFVVHGLWPQSHQGYPEFCQSSEPQRVPERIGRDLSDIMPSMGLIGHQWRKHGTCSGLSQSAYFDLTRRAFKAINIPSSFENAKAERNIAPDRVEQEFRQSNPQMSAQSIAVTCERNRIDEVRICMKSDLTFTNCPEVDRRGCRAQSATLPPIE